MFRFENPSVFNWLWVALALVLIYIFYSFRIDDKLKKAFNPRLLPALTQSRSLWRQRVKFAIQICVICGFIIALARPQAGVGSREIKSEGTQIVLMIDVSTSMLTRDMRSSRLDFAKAELTRFVDSLGGDKVGLVGFAGSAVLLAPLTSDKSAIKMLIEGLSTDSVSTQGTYFEKALQVSWETFKRLQSDNEDSVATRVVIVASDGEDNEEGALKVAEEMSKEGIKIFTLGFGTEEGGPVPNPNPSAGGFKRDKSGSEVISRFVPDALKKLSEVGGGSFYQVTFGNNAMANIKDDINKLQKAQFESLMQTEYSEKFQWILGLAIILALIELVLSERRSGTVIWRGRFGGVS